MTPCIRPRCRDCGRPADKAIARADDAGTEYYCAECTLNHFDAAPQQRSHRAQLDFLARKTAVLGPAR